MGPVRYKASSIAVFTCTFALTVGAECEDDCRYELPTTSLLQVDLSRQSKFPFDFANFQPFSNPAIGETSLADSPHHYSPNPLFEWSPTLQFASAGDSLSTQGGTMSDERIPRLLTMTGQPDTIAKLPAALRKNVMKTRALNDDLAFRYMGDKECKAYIQRHYDKELAQVYSTENVGKLRGDICRAAVLLLEGGFYADVDLDMAVPFTELVEDDTGPLQFMSALDASGMVYNAILGVVPNSPVMRSHLEKIRQWYRSSSDREGESQEDPLKKDQTDFDPLSSDWKMFSQSVKQNVPGVYGPSGPPQEADDGSANMGTITLKRALDSYIRETCSGFNLDSWRDDPKAKEVRWRCGPEKFILYREKDCNMAYSPKCSEERDNARDHQMKFGIVGSGKHDKYIAWSRVFEDHI